MAISPSKAALAEAAFLLGTDRKAARAYLRTVQHLSGPPTVGYETIVDVLRDAAEGSRQASRVAGRIRDLRRPTPPGGVGDVWRRGSHLIETEVSCVLGYLNAGRPSAALVLYFELPDELAFLVHTMSFSRKARWLERSHCVSLTIGPGRSGVETIQAEGDACRTDDDRHRADAIAIAERKAGRFGSSYLRSEHSVLYLVRPGWMRYSRYPSEDMPGEVHESTDLPAGT